MKKALVCGAGGFIGGHLVKRLKLEGFWVRGVDLKFHEHAETDADDFVIGDLRDQAFCRSVIDTRFDEVYQLAADMGGAGYIFTGEHDADVMHNSATINLNMLDVCYKRDIRTIFYSSSACMYPAYNQEDPDNPRCSEDSAYPAAPDSEYGWEKLFSERLYLAYRRNYGMQARVARYHNIFGPEGTWTGGREKAPAAIVPQGRHGARRRCDRDLGRRPADAVVPLHRRMPGGDDAADAVGFLRSGEHRLGGDGDDQPACRYGRRHRREANREAPRGRAAGRARSEFRQPADQQAPGLGAVAAAARWFGENVCVDRTTGAAEFGLTRERHHAQRRGFGVSIVLMPVHHEYIVQGGHRRVEGWIEDEALSFLMLLNCHQMDRDVTGAIAEIGVHHGRLFIALSTMRRPNEYGVAADVFEDQELNPDCSGHGDYERFISNLESFGVRDRQAILKRDSLTLTGKEFIASAQGQQVRLFSVDGSHTANHTTNDLRIAADALTGEGVVILDDRFNPDWPGVQEGFFGFVSQYGSILAPFAYGNSKLYLCKPESL